MEAPQGSKTISPLSSEHEIYANLIRACIRQLLEDGPSVKYENIYPNQHETVRQLQTGLTAYFDSYNYERPHQSLDYRTPAEEHFAL